MQAVLANRVSLGLTLQPQKGHDLADVPPDLDQNFSTVRQAMAETLKSATQLGISSIGTEMRSSLRVRRRCAFWWPRTMNSIHRYSKQARAARLIASVSQARPSRIAVSQSHAKAGVDVNLS